MIINKDDAVCFQLYFNKRIKINSASSALFSTFTCSSAEIILNIIIFKNHNKFLP